jgi:hypothetical protein
MNHVITLFLVVGFFLIPRPARSNTLFEGWFEIYLGAKKVGYLTERYEFTPDNKFKSTYYLKTNKDGGDITESLKAFANPSLAPISYAYTSKSAGEVKIVDATFKGEQMTLKIIEGKKEHKEVKKIKKGTFLSTFLIYLVMGSEKAGLKLNNNYIYSAIAEEEGVAYNGQALISSKEKVKGKDTFKVLNKFKTGTKNEEKFFTWVTDKGEVMLTRSPEKNIDVRFAENEVVATQGMMVAIQDLKLLFGNKIPGDSSEMLDEKKKPVTVKEPLSPKKATGPTVISAGEVKINPPTTDLPAKKDAELNEALPPASQSDVDQLEIKKKGK